MQVGTKVRIVDHEGYEKILRVGDVGEVSKIEEETIFVTFDGGGDNKEEIDYPAELVKELTEADQKQLGGGGKSGMPDTSKPTPPQMSTDNMDLKGEQKHPAQADSGETRPGGEGSQTAGVTSADVKIDGEQKHPPQTSGGTSSATRPDMEGGSQSAGVKGDQVEVKGEQKQLGDVPAREVVKGVKESRVFRPITLAVLEQGDGEDEYVAIGEGSSIRSEAHIVRAVKGAVHKAMESMDKPFDRVEIVFRRDAVAESERRDAEKKLIAALHLLDEGKGSAKQVRGAAHAAAKNGLLTSRFESYTDDRYAKQVLTEAQQLVENVVGGPVEVIWPPARLSEHVGDHMIIETVFGDRLVGTLAKGPGRMFQIKTRSGTHRFSPHDVNRILRKPGAK